MRPPVLGDRLLEVTRKGCPGARVTCFLPPLCTQVSVLSCGATTMPTAMSGHVWRSLPRTAADCDPNHRCIHLLSIDCLAPAAPGLSAYLHIVGGRFGYCLYFLLFGSGRKGAGDLGRKVHFSKPNSKGYNGSPKKDALERTFRLLVLTRSSKSQTESYRVQNWSLKMPPPAPVWDDTSGHMGAQFFIQYWVAVWQPHRKSVRPLSTGISRSIGYKHPAVTLYEYGGHFLNFLM